MQPISEVEARKTVHRCRTERCAKTGIFHVIMQEDDYGACFMFCKGCCLNWVKWQIIHRQSIFEITHRMCRGWLDQCYLDGAHDTRTR